MRNVGRALVTIVVSAIGALALGGTAGAQQIVDAGKEGDGSGGLAFVLLALLVMLIWAALFFMDRIRRRSSESAE